MLLDPLGPLAIRWQYLPRLMPWLWRFWRAGVRRRVEAITASLAALVGRAWTDWDAVIAEAKIGDLFVRNGALFVYRTEAGLRDAAYEWELRRGHGVKAEAIDGHEIRKLEPALSPEFVRGYFVPDWGHVLDPHRVVARLAEHLRARGGDIRAGRAKGVEFSDGRPAAVRLEDGTRERFDGLVVCAGAWSKSVCAWLGHDVPLDTERGYNTTLPNPGVHLSRAVCPAESSFLMTPMAMGLRIGGAVELAGLDAPPNFARAKALLELGRRALPGLDVANGKEWMGFRPSMPELDAGHQPRAASFGHGVLRLRSRPSRPDGIGDDRPADRTARFGRAGLDRHRPVSNRSLLNCTLRWTLIARVGHGKPHILLHRCPYLRQSGPRRGRRRPAAERQDDERAAPALPRGIRLDPHRPDVRAARPRRDVGLDSLPADAGGLRRRHPVHRGLGLPADVRSWHDRHGHRDDRARLGKAAHAWPAQPRYAGRPGRRRIQAGGRVRRNR